MNGFSARRALVGSAAAAILTLLATQQTNAAAPGFYYAAPQAAVHAEAPPFAGTHNYGTHVQTFRWGWFGAEHFYPTNRSHKEQTGNVMRWSRWRRY